MSDIQFYVSSAGLAGDSFKLLVGVQNDIKLVEGFIEGFFGTWNFKRAKKRLIKKFKILEASHIESTDNELLSKVDFSFIKELSEGDLIIVQCKERMSPEQTERISAVMSGLKLKCEYLIVPYNLEIDRVYKNVLMNKNGVNE